MLTILFVGSGAEPFWVELDFSLMSRDARVAWCALHEIGAAFHTVQPDAVVVTEEFNVSDLRNLVALVGTVPLVVMRGETPKGAIRVDSLESPDETADALVRAIGRKGETKFKSNEVFGQTGEWELPRAGFDADRPSSAARLPYRATVLVVTASAERAELLSQELTGARIDGVDIACRVAAPTWGKIIAERQHDPDIVLLDNLDTDLTQELLPRFKTETRFRWAQVVLFQKSKVRRGALDGLVQNLRQEHEKLHQEIAICEKSGATLELSRRGPARWMRILSMSKRGLQCVLRSPTERVRFDVQGERVLSVWSERGGRAPTAGAQALAALLTFERGTLAVKALPKGAPAPWNSDLQAALKEADRMLFGARLSIASPTAMRELQRSLPPMGPRPSPKDVDNRKQQVVRRMAAWAKTSYAGAQPSALMDSTAEIAAVQKPVDLARLLFDGSSDPPADSLPAHPLNFKLDIDDEPVGPSPPTASLAPPLVEEVVPPDVAKEAQPKVSKTKPRAPLAAGFRALFAKSKRAPEDGTPPGKPAMPTWVSNVLWAGICLGAAVVGGAVGSLMGTGNEVPEGVAYTTAPSPIVIVLQPPRPIAPHEAVAAALLAISDAGVDADNSDVDSSDADSSEAALEVPIVEDVGAAIAADVDSGPTILDTAVAPALVVANVLAPLRALVERHPEDHHAKIELATRLLEMGQAVEAVSLLEQAVAARPRRASYRVLMATAYDAVGNVEAAAAARAEALRLDP